MWCKEGQIIVDSIMRVVPHRWKMMLDMVTADPASRSVEEVGNLARK